MYVDKSTVDTTGKRALRIVDGHGTRITDVIFNSELTAMSASSSSVFAVTSMSIVIIKIYHSRLTPNDPFGDIRLHRFKFQVIVYSKL